MFCITGIFKCFTPHEDARRATPRHATPRRPAIYASLSYDSFFLSFRLPNQPSSNFLASLVAVFPLLPLYSLLFFSLFSTDQQHPQSACANWSPVPPSPRESETIMPARGGKRKKEISIFFLRVSSTRFGDKVLFFFSSSFFFFVPFITILFSCAIFLCMDFTQRVDACRTTNPHVDY